MEKVLHFLYNYFCQQGTSENSSVGCPGVFSGAGEFSSLPPGQTGGSALYSTFKTFECAALNRAIS
jgi:hypothetical protein